MLGKKFEHSIFYKIWLIYRPNKESSATVKIIYD